MPSDTAPALVLSPAERETLEGRAIAVAPAATHLAVITLVLSGIAIALFFGGVAYVFGPINDVLISATLVLLVPTALAVRRLAAGHAGTWLDIVTWLAIAGMVGVAVGQLLLVVGVIDLQTSFVTGGIGFLPVLLWIGAVSYLALRSDAVDRPVGVWGAAFLATSGVAAAGIPVLPQPVLYSLGVPLAIGAVGFLWTLGRSLRRRLG